MDTLDALYTAVQTRPRPEDVAALIAVANQNLTRGEQKKLAVASRHSWRNLLSGQRSQMPADFARPTTRIARQGALAETLLSVPAGLTAAEWLDAGRVAAFCDAAERVLGSARTKRQRRALGIWKNARWYNKRVRLLATIRRKATRYAWNCRRYDYTRAANSALAVSISRDDLLADLDTACFVAYMSARMSLRSTFTNGSQVRAFDEIAEMLLARCERSSTARFDVIACVLPDARVLARLTPEQVGGLLGRCWTLMSGMADMLADVYAQTTGFDLATMVVARGQDSSTWNAVAGGWNVIRSQWLSLLYALGADEMLRYACPGKVMRLMAADVARWHALSGGDVHPDTKVWAELPEPWRVLRGETPCSVDMIRDACVRNGAAVETWIGRRGDREPVPFTPTPELVHGVAVASPSLATALRKAGVFSGKDVRDGAPPHTVTRDETGAATFAS